MAERIRDLKVELAVAAAAAREFGPGCPIPITRGGRFFRDLCDATGISELKLSEAAIGLNLWPGRAKTLTLLNQARPGWQGKELPPLPFPPDADEEAEVLVPEVAEQRLQQLAGAARPSRLLEVGTRIRVSDAFL